MYNHPIGKPLNSPNTCHQVHQDSHGKANPKDKHCQCAKPAGNLVRHRPSCNNLAHTLHQNNSKWGDIQQSTHAYSETSEIKFKHLPLLD